jgi:hypothetical protein
MKALSIDQRAIEEGLSQEVMRYCNRQFVTFYPIKIGREVLEIDTLYYQHQKDQMARHDNNRLVLFPMKVLIF